MCRGLVRIERVLWLQCMSYVVLCLLSIIYNGKYRVMKPVCTLCSVNGVSSKDAKRLCAIV